MDTSNWNEPDQLNPKLPYIESEVGVSVFIPSPATLKRGPLCLTHTLYYSSTLQISILWELPPDLCTDIDGLPPMHQWAQHKSALPPRLKVLSSLISDNCPAVCFGLLNSNCHSCGQPFSFPVPARALDRKTMPELEASPVLPAGFSICYSREETCIVDYQCMCLGCPVVKETISVRFFLNPK